MIHNVVSERVVLSTLINNKEIREEVITEITSDVFFNDLNKNIFDFIFDLYVSKKEITPDVIIAEFNEFSNKVEDILFTAPAVLKTIPIHIKNIKQAAYNRKILAKIDLIKEKIKNGEFVNINSEFKNIEVESDEQEIRSLSDIIKSYEEQVEKLDENNTATGIPSLDKKIYTSPGDLIIIGARPSMGKTAFMLSIALNKVSQGFGATIFSLEMPEEKIIGRAISHLGKIHMKEIVRGKFSDYVKYRETKNKLIEKDDSLKIIDSVNYLHSICMQIERIHKKNPKIEDYFIDHAGFIRTKEDITDDHKKLGFITKELKSLAKRLGVKIWLLSQLNRNVEQRPNKRPTLSDLRASGSIEEDADLILGLYRDSYYRVKEGKEKEEIHPNPMEILMLKQRDGETGTVELSFNGPIMTVGDNFAQEYMASPSNVIEYESQPNEETKQGIEVQSFQQTEIDMPVLDDLPPAF